MLRLFVAPSFVLLFAGCFGADCALTGLVTIQLETPPSESVSETGSWDEACPSLRDAMQSPQRHDRPGFVDLSKAETSECHDAMARDWADAGFGEAPYRHFHVRFNEGHYSVRFRDTCDQI